MSRSQEVLVVPMETIVLLKLLDAELHALFSQQNFAADEPLPAWLTESLLSPLLDLLKRLVCQQILLSFFFFFSSVLPFLPLTLNVNILEYDHADPEEHAGTWGRTGNRNHPRPPAVIF